MVIYFVASEVKYRLALSNCFFYLSWLSFFVPRWFNSKVREIFKSIAAVKFINQVSCKSKWGEKNWKWSENKEKALPRNIHKNQMRILTHHDFHNRTKSCNSHNSLVQCTYRSFLLKVITLYLLSTNKTVLSINAEHCKMFNVTE